MDGAAFRAYVGESPATVIVPVRDDDELTSTVYPTVPFPVPLPPDVTWIHDALETAVHAQPTPVEVEVGVEPLRRLVQHDDRLQHRRRRGVAGFRVELRQVPAQHQGDLAIQLDRAAEAEPNPGRTDGLQRLNRTEYRNAIRDLLALDVDVSSLLPKDDASHGFDNVSIGGISTTLLERYISAAQKISRLAVGSPVRSPATGVVVIRPDLTQEEHVEGLPFGTRGGTVFHYNFPRNGEYEIQLRLTRDRNEAIEGCPHLFFRLSSG